MALQDLKTDLDAIMKDSAAYETIAKVVGGGSGKYAVAGSKVHTIEIDVEETAKRIRSATIDGIKQHYKNEIGRAEKYIEAHKSAYHIDNFNVAVLDTINTFSKPQAMYGNKGTRFRSSSKGIFRDVVRDTQAGLAGKALFIVQPSNMNYLDFLSVFRNFVFRTWRADTGRALLPSDNPSHKRRTYSETDRMPDGRPVPGAEFEKQYAEGVHDPHSVYEAWIELRAHEIQAEISAIVGTVDLVQDLLNAIDIDWEEDTTYNSPTGALEQKRIVSVKMGIDNIPLIYDKAGIPDIIDAITNLQHGYLLRWKYLNDREALIAAASPTFKQQAAAAAQYKILQDLMLKNKKYVGLKKIKTKKPDTKPRSANLKKAKPRKRVQKNKISLAQQVRVQAKVERGIGKEANTKQVTDLARLKTYINSRLPAEVRRNMGRPALRNRTGRFSNSVQLLSLQQAQNSIMAKYTYLLSPYQTFENTGRKRWPLAYNPKDLIAKSIRNLAQGRIEQKLTVRRV